MDGREDELMLLSLAAGTVLDVDPSDVPGIAAHAGFTAAGVRLSRLWTKRRAVAQVRHASLLHGIEVLDVEVARLGHTPPAELRALAAAAGALRARFLLAVSEHEDFDRTVEQFAALCDAAADYGVTVALEFMGFTAVRSFDAASRVLDAAGRANAVVLVDVLHLHRSGATPAGLASERVGYVQLCDIDTNVDAPTSGDDLREEARRHRLLPGNGSLPLRELLAGAGAGVPASIEVQSDELMRRMSPAQRALAAMRAARAVTCS